MQQVNNNLINLNQILKDQIYFYLIIQTFKNQFHFQQITKVINTSKTVLYVLRKKYKNKGHFNAKWVKFQLSAGKCFGVYQKDNN